MTLLELTLIISYITFIFLALKNRNYVGFVFVAFYSLTILNLIGIESNKFIIYLLLLLGGISYLFFSGNQIPKLRSNMSNYYIYVFIILIILSYILSPAIVKPYAFNKFISTVITIAIPLTVLLFAPTITKSDIQIIINSIIVTSTVVSLIVLLSAMTEGGIMSGSYFLVRISVGLINEIWLARLLSLSIIFVFAKDFRIPSFYKLLLILIMIIALFFTGSKIMIYFLPLVLLIYLLRNLSMRNIVATVTIVFIVGLLLSFILSNFDTNALLLRFGLQSNTISQRIILFRMSLDSYTKGNIISYLFGNGFGTVPYSLFLPDERIYPHNIIIEILYELGIVGVFIFIFSIFKIIFNSVKNNILFYGMILFLLFSFSSGDLAGNNFLFIFIALASMKTDNTTKIARTNI